FPALVADQLGLSLSEQRLDCLRPGLLWCVAGRRVAVGGCEIGEDRIDGLLRVLLVGADHPGGTSLDPADDVLAWQGLTRLGVGDAARGVGDHAGALVERDARQRDAAIADRP